MRRTPGARRPGARAGFTLLELLISAGVLTMLGFALADAIRMADNSHSAVSQAASTNRAQRAATTRLQRELKSARAATLVVAAGIDGNSEVTLQHPIEVAGNAVWGVHDRRLGPTEAQHTRENWSLRYTVRDVDLGAGQVDRRLLRQVLDDTGDARFEDVLLSGLASGANPAGFTMVENGGVWEVALRCEGGGGSNGRVSVFHVRTRN